MVGEWSDLQASPSAFPWMWTAAGGYVRLADYLTSAGINLGNYQLRDVVGISPDGRTLYGTGLDNGIQPSGWIAVVPEPSAAAILLAAGATMLLRPQRVRRRA